MAELPADLKVDPTPGEDKKILECLGAAVIMRWGTFRPKSNGNSSNTRLPRAAALAAAHRQGKCPADVPIYCAEWKAPGRFTHRVLGPQPGSRVTNQRRLSEDEVAVLFEAIGDDLDSIGFSPRPNTSDDGSEQQRMRHQNPEDKMTDRELVGVILSGGGPATLRAPSSDLEKPVASFCTPSRKRTSGLRKVIAVLSEICPKMRAAPRRHRRLHGHPSHGGGCRCGCDLAPAHGAMNRLAA